MQDTEKGVTEALPPKTAVRPNYEETSELAEMELDKALKEFQQLIINSATNEAFEENERKQARFTKVIERVSQRTGFNSDLVREKSSGTSDMTERMKKAIKEENMGGPIPPNLPSLQMQGDKDIVQNKPVYETIDKFVEAFDTIMKQHKLNLDKSWEVCFVSSIQHSVEKTTWFKKNLEGQKLGWNQAKSTIEHQFGGDFTKQWYMERLTNMKCGKHENPVKFVEEFATVLQGAAAGDHVGLGFILLKALSNHMGLVSQIRSTFATTNKDSRTELDVAYIARMTPQLYVEQLHGQQ